MLSMVSFGSGGTAIGSLLGSGAGAGLPAWTWLLPLAALALAYPVSAWRDAPVFPTPRDALAGLDAQVALAPAGTHRAKTVVPTLLADDKVKDVVWDPGYSLCKPNTAYWPLARAGMHCTFTPVTHQRSTKPFDGDALVIDGQLYSSLLPEELRSLPMPPRGASEDDKRDYEQHFNRRALLPAEPVSADIDAAAQDALRRLADLRPKH